MVNSNLVVAWLVTFVLLFCIVVAFLFSLVKVLYNVKKKQPQLWERLGNPSIILLNSTPEVVSDTLHYLLFLDEEGKPPGAAFLKSLFYLAITILVINLVEWVAIAATIKFR